MNTKRIAGGQNVVNAAVKQEIVKLHKQGMSFGNIAKQLGLALGTVKTHWYLSEGQATAPQRIPESPYPRYDDPPTLEGDALVIPDSEIPFHHAEFMNRVFDIADAWGIKQCIWAGDALHFDSLSGWEPNWAKEPNGGLSESDEARLLTFAKKLPDKYQQELIEHIVDIGGNEADGGFSGEMHYARKTFAAIDDLFAVNLWVMGNHEGRLLRAINSPVQPSELLNLMKLDEGRWKIAPFYYAILRTNKGDYRITHPKGSSNGMARKMASQYLQHILMAHSHKTFFDWDISGRYYAIQMGACVDESRLPYASQRDAIRDSHKEGAVIVREGHPYLLHDGIDWERTKGMK